MSGQAVPVTGSPVLSVDVLLADGTTAQIRVASLDDADAIERLFERVSRETLYLRYFGPRPHATAAAELEQVIAAEGTEVGVLVMVLHDLIVGIAQYHRTPGKTEAEVAFLVDDAFQGHGVGTMLLEHLAEYARLHGIRRFVADTLAENQKMLHVFADAGFVRQYTRDAEVIRIVFDIDPAPEALAAAEIRDHVAVVQSMRRMLQPKSIAVVGAGRRRGTIGHELFRNLLAGDFNGPVYPINVAGGHVASVPCWKEIGDVPGDVDLAVIAVPDLAVLEAIEACGRKGVASLVIITAGFAESGQLGVDAQRALTRLAHLHGMRLVGPNCFGIINTDSSVSMNATFAAQPPLPGAVGFASQSGGLGIAILAEAATRGLGLSSFVSMGNKADVSGNDLLEWWEEDESTDVILLYLESFGNPRKFSRIARRVSRSKPIVAVKGGRSRAGSRAASSHTAALASSDRAVDALFEQTGVVRVETIEELFDVAEVLAHQPLPPGRRVAVVGNAGGPGVLVADACASRGLEVPEFTDALRSELAELLPSAASITNPVDLAAGANAQSFSDALTAVLRSDEVDAAVVIFTPPLVTRADDVANAVRTAADALAETGCERPVVASFLGAERVREILGAARRPVPVFAYPENAVRALAHGARYASWRSRPEERVPVLDKTDANEARRLIGASTAAVPAWLTGAEAGEVLSTYGLPVLTTSRVADAAAAAAEATRLGFPVVLKAWGAELVHKTERGGVRLGLADGAAVVEAFEQMVSTLGDAMEGAVLQPMVGAGVETIVGFVQDPAFGPQVVFGLGGTAVEILDDSVTRLVPLTESDARHMILGLRASQLLLGYRGSTPVDIDALVNVVLRMSKLAEDVPEIAEADCNPVIAGASGAWVIDARLRIAPDAVVTPDVTRHLR